MTKIAVLASHNGSGLDALYKASKEKILDIEIVLVISNNTNAKALQNAKEYKIANFLLNDITSDNPHARMEELLHAHGCEYIFLSGYMKKLSSNITTNFKVINSHPSLLPNYSGAGMYGRFVHEAIIKNKEAISGVTIHEVNENYDEGKIILQKSISLSKDETVDSLQVKIKALEATAIIDAFKLCLK
ncbi:MAG: formyltransferase family protein [Sulfurimonas sp.]|jgi:phosphoribosylglycinamide formyltransferase-1